MKFKGRKTKKILAGILGLALIGILIFLAIGFVGNPISRMLVNSSAKRYASRNYKELDLELGKSYYNFKDGRYIVEARSDTSVDTHFELEFTGSGRLAYDSYEDSVLDGWNTWQRINEEYEELVRDVIETEFTEINEMSYGMLIDIDDDHRDLELDKKYDIRKLAETRGKLVLYIESVNLNNNDMAELLLELKEKFDKKDIPFYLLDMSIIAPASDEVELESERIMDFPYDDIYEENLVKRVEKNMEDTKKHDEEMDIEKEKEIDEYGEDAEKVDD